MRKKASAVMPVMVDFARMFAQPPRYVRREMEIFADAATRLSPAPYERRRDIFFYHRRGGERTPTRRLYAYSMSRCMSDVVAR